MNGNFCEALRALEKAIEVVDKSTPGPWTVNDARMLARGNRMLRIVAGVVGIARVNANLDDRENAEAIIAAVNFIREHGAVILSARQEVAPEWFCIKTPGADYDYTFVKTREEAIDLQDCDEPDEPMALYSSPAQTSEARDAEKDAEIARLNAIINSPQSDDFLRAVSTEAEHQRQRWGSDHDAGKTPADWFWLVGYLGGKALHSQAAGDTDKAEHHIITTAAACANWHRAMFGRTDMRPGIAGQAAMQAKEAK